MGILQTILFATAYAGLITAKELECPKNPHIVLMLADDLGWSDVSFHGSKQIPTPNIDSLARDGIILNHFYVQPTCSPSRGSIMTGQYPIRFGFQHEVIAADQDWGLPLKETILPQYLKSLEYDTHAVGKWHLGFFKEEYLPLKRGFDSFFGYYTGIEHYFTHFASEENATGLDLHCDYKNVWKYNGTYGTELFTAKAKTIIRDHNPTKPLFLYFAQQAVHSGSFQTHPIQVPEKYVKPLVGIDSEKRRRFAGMVQALDQSVGEIIETLECSGMLNNTLFVFMSDNGAPVEQEQDGTLGSNFPLRGTKYNLWEGGTRSASFVWAPCLRNRSRIHNQLMHISDWLPTLLSAAGGSRALQMLKDIDGVDQWPSLTHDVPSPRSEILLDYDDQTDIKALRKGQFKYLKGSYYNGSYDGWYDVEGLPINGSSPPPESPAKKRLYYKTYLKFLRRSKAARVLWRKYHRNPCLAISCLTPECKKQLEVKCGPRPEVDTCKPNEGPCLFDVIKDPCEFYNIIEERPDIAAEMKESIEQYRPFIVPEGRRPRDPRANPKLHGGAWVPWL